MPRGGARPGAGRKPGGKNKPRMTAHEGAKELARTLISGPPEQTPLAVMLRMMNRLAALADKHHAEGSLYIEGPKEDAEVFTPSRLAILALDAASKAAPYLHPKLVNQGNAREPVGGKEYEAWLEELDDDSPLSA